jgi:hypothetical protein
LALRSSSARTPFSAVTTLIALPSPHPPMQQHQGLHKMICETMLIKLHKCVCETGH